MGPRLGGEQPAGGIDVSPSPAAAVAEAFTVVDAAVDELMAALATLEVQPAGRVSWSRDQASALVEAATVLSNRAARVRSRAMSVVAAVREQGGLHHLDDSQLAASAGRFDPRDARRDQHLAGALGNGAPAPARERGGAVPGVENEGLLDSGAGDEDGGGDCGADCGDAGEIADGAGATRRGASPRFPVLARAFDAGVLSDRHATIIVNTLQDLPGELSGDQRQQAEQTLVDWAMRMNPASLRRRALRVLEELGYNREDTDVHENAQVAAAERAAWENTKLWMVDNQDGAWNGHFTLPDLQAHMLKKALDALMAPRRRNGAGGGGRLAATGDRAHDRAMRDQARGQAFCELIDHLPADEITTRTNAVLLVRTDLGTLRGQTDRAGVTDSGAVLSAGEVRRMAATAGIVPVVLGGASQVLDLGRQTRRFTASQRTALAVSYDGCAEADCDRPLSWCEIHHADPWEAVLGEADAVLHPGGGRTDLANAIPLCGRHHRQLEDPRLRHTITRDATGRATVAFTWRRAGEPWSTRVQEELPAGAGPPGPRAADGPPGAGQSAGVDPPDAGEPARPAGRPAAGRPGGGSPSGGPPDVGPPSGGPPGADPSSVCSAARAPDWT